MWSLLFLTLPTQPSAIRLRFWRALKALGCGSLRDGACVLPVANAARLDPLEAVLSGLREVHADDDQLNLAAATVFDALYAAPEQAT